jgi:hypothetical protein
MLWGTPDDDFGDLRLEPTSPAIDAADNSVPEFVDFPFDLDGNPRRVDIAWVADTGNGNPPTVDMGAYEAQPIFFYLPFAWK